MTSTADMNVLNGIGRKMRGAYLQGRVSEEDILSMYRRNLKEADGFDPFGWTSSELRREAAETHNPVLRERILAILDEQKTKAAYSRMQNSLNLEKLGFYNGTALGMGIRPVMRELGRLARAGSDEARILLLLLQTEFANLHAKKRTALSKTIYERKDILLRQVSDLLYDHGWPCGISAMTGKNASYVIYVYLPDGAQVSWHCNDCSMYLYYDHMECAWDGLSCSTMEKLLTYAHMRFGIGTPLVTYEMSMAS